MSGVADLIVSRLRETGVRTLFGVPGGGGNLDLIESAGRAGLPFVLTSTETGAAIAAIAQTEVTGRPGACLTTLGPGAASAVNGVACAFLDRAPIVVFTDSHPVGARGMFAHQHIDHLALLEPITKWSARLEPGRVSRTIDEAFNAMATMPPGPVHIDCPGDVNALDDDNALSTPPLNPLSFKKILAVPRSISDQPFRRISCPGPPAFRVTVVVPKRPTPVCRRGWTVRWSPGLKRGGSWKSH